MSCPRAPSYRYPSYGDLGKECRDLFNNGYHFGLFKINVMNSTCHGMDIKTSGTHMIEDKTAKADVEVKAAYPVKGLTSIHRWDTENVMTNKIRFQDLFPGGQLGVDLRLNPDNLNKGGAFNIQYKHPKFTLDANTDGADDSNILVGATVVTGHRGLLAGYKLDYDTAEGTLKANNMALGYACRDYGLLLTFDNLTILNGYYFHRINRELEIAAQASVGGGEEGGPLLGVAGLYKFSGYGHALRAKVDNRSMLGLGLELKIINGFSTFFSGNIDLKNFAAGNHKIGFGLEFGY